MPGNTGGALIRGGAVLVQDASRPGQCEFHQGWDVVVRGDRIAFAGPDGAALAPAGCAQFDATGMIVMPGFVNAHTHVSMALFRGYAQDLGLHEWLETKIWPAESRLTRDDIRTGALLACAEMLRAGVTAFGDMYFFMDGVAEAAREAGLRATISQGMIGLKEEDRKRTVRASLDLLEKWHGAENGRIRVMLGPHAPYTCPPGFLGEVGKESERLGVPVHMHLAETRREVDECLERYGKTPVQLAVDAGLAGVHLLAAHCVHITDDDIRLLSSTRAFVAHCPASNMNLACGIAPVSRMLSAGVTVGLGTDGPASGATHDMFSSMRIAALAQKHREMDPTALPAKQALWLATRGGALSLGLADTGLVAAGMKADLVCVSTRAPHFQPGHDPAACIVHCSRPEDVELVMVDGRILKRGRSLLTLDEDDILAEAESVARRLVPRS